MLVASLTVELLPMDAELLVVGYFGEVDELSVAWLIVELFTTDDVLFDCG